MKAERSPATTPHPHGYEAVRAARRVRVRESVLGLAAPLMSIGTPTRGWSAGAPVLLYHRVVDDDESSVDPFAVRRSDFVEQVRYMADHFRLVTVSEVARRVAAGEHLGGLAAFTFDDGYECTFRNAWPVLRDLDAPATLFVDTGRLDGARPALTAAELVAMAGEGLEIGSHTVSHCDVSTVSEAELARELRESVRVLRDLTGQPVGGFAYPFGRYSDRDVRIVREAGLDHACTCRQDGTNRPGADPLQLRRLEINLSDDRNRFLRKITGAYARAYRVLYAAFGDGSRTRP